MKNKNVNRREFLKTSSRAGIVAGLSTTALTSFARNQLSPLVRLSSESTPYKQQPLPYAFNALEPMIDAMTMEIHYGKHAAAYAKNLGEAVQAENVDTAKISLEDLLGNISKYSAKMRNNAGGHYNHELFWKLMSAPSGTSGPSGKLLMAIQKEFGSLEAFRTQFSDAAKSRFGSGWAWLIMSKDKKLFIASTPNQDNPLMNISEVKGFPILGLDVWEHAYYLKYQNKRADYIIAWWNVLNWNFIRQRFEQI